MDLRLLRTNIVERKEISEKIHREVERYYSLKPGSYENVMTYSEKGKPSIPGNNRFFNISHGKEMHLIGFSEQNIGVDIEKIQFIENRLVERFYSKREKLKVRFSYNKEKTKTMIWTRKEALCKFTGKGICKETLLQDTFSNNGCYIKSFCVEGYCISVCIQNKERIFLNRRII